MKYLTTQKHAKYESVFLTQDSITCRSSLLTCTIIGARLAQSVEHETLNLRVVGSSPTLGGEMFFSFSPEKSLNHSKSSEQECLEKRRKK